MSSLRERLKDLGRHKENYVLNNLARHLFEAGQHKQLYHLITASKDWLEVQFNASNSPGDGAYREQLELAMNTLSDPLNKESVITLIALCTTQQILAERVRIRDDNELKAYALTGDLNMALSYAKTRSDPMETFDGLMSIYEEISANQWEILTPEQDFDEAIRRMKDSADQARALRKLAMLYARVGKLEVAQQFLNQASEVSLTVRDVDNHLKALRLVAQTLVTNNNYPTLEKINGLIDEIEQNLDDSKVASVRDLARSGNFVSAQEVLSKIQNSQVRQKTSYELGSLLARARRFKVALTIIETRSLDDFLRLLAEWEPIFEKVNSGLSLDVFREAARIMGWIRDDWRHVHEILVENRGS